MQDQAKFESGNLQTANITSESCIHPARLARSAVFSCLLAMPTMAFSQTESGPVVPLVPRVSAEDVAPPPPGGRSATVLDGIAFDVSVSEDESEAAVQFGSVKEDDPSEAGQIHNSWSVRLSVPVGGGDDLTSGSTWDGLLDGPRLTVSFSWLGAVNSTMNANSPGFARVRTAAARGCERYALRGISDAALSDSGVNSTTTPESRLGGVQSRMISCRSLASRSLQGASRQEVARVIDDAVRYSGWSRAAIGRSLFSLWEAGFEASLGVDRFDFIRQPTLDETDVTKPFFSAGLRLAYYPASGRHATIASLDYENGYELADPEIICRPAVVDPNEDCVSGVPAPPDHAERLVLGLEHRWSLMDSFLGLGSLGIGPGGNVDLLTGEYELELPLYIVPNWDLPISPGIGLSYSSEDDEVTFGVFLRTSFAVR